TPALYVAGTRNFANNKQLKRIQELQRQQNDLLKSNARLVDQQMRGNFVKATSDINAEINANLDMIGMYETEIVENMNIVEENIKKKGMKEEAAKGYSQMQVGLADIRNKVLEISNDPNKTDAQKKVELEALGKQYNEISYYQNLFTDTETFGSLYAALGGSSILQNPFSAQRKKFRQVTQQAKDNIKKSKGENHKITRDEINTEAENILIDEKADVQLKKDEVQSKKLGHNFQVYGTKEEATTNISKLYDEAIESAGKETARGKKLLDDKVKVLQKINKGTLNGLSIQVKDLINLDFVVRDNMRNNRRFTTGLHEQTHRISKELIAANPEAFKNLGRQIISYLSFTGQDAALLKMNVDNPNIKADGEYDFDEVISSFMELIAEDKVDLERMDNFIAISGKLFNEGLKNATGGKYNIEFTGENDILAYFLRFGEKLASGEIDIAEIQELKSKINPEGKLIKLPVSEAVQSSIEQDALRASETDKNMFTKVREVYDSDQSLTDKGFEIGSLYRNFVTSRLNKGFNVGKLFIKPRDFDGFNNEILEDVVSDMATGGSGVPGLVKAYANRDMKRFGDITLPQWINSRLNQRILGYLPNDLVSNDMSIDSETARQIEDVKSRKFENVFDADVESGPREITPVEELSIVTPELVDEVKDIVTKTLKRTALTEGISNETVLADLNKAIEKEITKVIKSKMGPISKSVLGFAPKQYTDFIKNEMMTIVKSMPVNLIKQKAKSKAWAEVFKLKEIGREDIKKVNPDTGKVTYYRKQIFEVEKPDPQKFQKYFTRGGYTTLIERQKSLIKPMAEQL
ncbi:MAG: hypothetical protein ACW98X_26240, partial [Promethearchaeota archaeon]